MSKKTGVKGAVDALRADGAAVDVAPPLPLDLPEGEAPAKRGAGRPAGSRNRVTAAMLDYLRRTYADPLEVLAQGITIGVDELALRLNCSRKEAWQMQKECARDLAPYLYSKIPANLSIDGHGSFRLVIGEDADGGPIGQGEDGTVFDVEAIRVDAPPDETEQDQ